MVQHLQAARAIAHITQIERAANVVHSLCIIALEMNSGKRLCRWKSAVASIHTRSHSALSVCQTVINKAFCRGDPARFLTFNDLHRRASAADRVVGDRRRQPCSSLFPTTTRRQFAEYYTPRQLHCGSRRVHSRNGRTKKRARCFDRFIRSPQRLSVFSGFSSNSYKDTSQKNGSMGDANEVTMKNKLDHFNVITTRRNLSFFV